MSTAKLSLTKLIFLCNFASIGRNRKTIFFRKLRLQLKGFHAKKNQREGERERKREGNRVKVRKERGRIKGERDIVGRTERGNIVRERKRKREGGDRMRHKD